MIETRLVGRHVEKPTEQQVEGDPFAQYALGAHRVEAHEHHRFQETLWRNAWPAVGAIRCGEGPTHRRMCFVRHALDRAKLMIRRNQILEIDIDEHGGLTSGATSHENPYADIRPCGFLNLSRLSELFNSLRMHFRGSIP